MAFLLLFSPFILMAGLIAAGLSYLAALLLSIAIVALLVLHGHWVAWSVNAFAREHPMSVTHKHVFNQSDAPSGMQVPEEN